MEQSERMRILELVAQGKLSASEAEVLLRHLAEAPAPAAEGTESSAPVAEAEPGKRPRRMRIHVTDARTNRSRVHVVLPLSVVKAGLRLGMALKPWTWSEAKEEGGAPDEVMAHLGENLSELTALFDEAEIGPLVDAYDEEDGERVLIALE